MLTYPESVVIEEQGPRDGLQAETLFVPTATKLELIQACVDSGLKRIQVTSFVNPQMVPQLADAEDLCAGLRKADGVIYSALALNARGMQRAVDAGMTHVEASISASDAHSRRNANLSLPEARRIFRDMLKIAMSAGVAVRGGLQCVFGCRYEGRIDPAAVIDMARQHLDQGVDEIALADSTGMADPRSVAEICSAVVEIAGGKPVFLHLHDTEGKGLANVLSAMQAGVRHFDATFGGTGGCPFIKGATGNIATEDVVVMLDQMGIRSGIHAAGIAAVSRSLEDYLGRRFSGKMHRLLARDDIRILRGWLPGSKAWGTSNEP